MALALASTSSSSTTTNAHTNAHASVASAHTGAHRNRTTTFAAMRARARRATTTTATTTRTSNTSDAERLLDCAFADEREGGGEIRVTIDRIDGAPMWVMTCERATRDLAKLREGVRALGEAHAKALLPNFDDVDREDVVASALTKEVTKLFKSCDEALRAVTTTGEKGEASVRLNAQRKLAMELNKLSQEFRKQQKDYLQKLKSQQDRGPGAAGIDGFARFSRGGDASEASFGGAGGSMQMELLNRAETVSIERDREVMKILESVNDLAAVMKDLSALIIDQGTILDRIDYNCEAVAASVEQGRQELVRAEKSQKSSAAVMCIYLLLFMIVLMLMIVIFEKI